MSKRSLEQLSKSEITNYKSSVKEWLTPLISGTVTDVFEEFDQLPSSGVMPSTSAIMSSVMGRVTMSDIDELAGDQGIEFKSSTQLLGGIRVAIHDSVAVKLALSRAAAEIEDVPVDSTVDWEDTLGAHSTRLQKHSIARLARVIVADAHEVDDDGSDEDEDEEESEGEEEEEEQEEQEEEEEEEEEEQDVGEEEEEDVDDAQEVSEELEEIKTEEVLR